MSKIPVLDVSFNPPEVIVFVTQSDSIADVSIQRGQSTFDPSTSFVAIVTVVPDELFQGRQDDRWTYVVDCLVLGEVAVCEPDVSRCCRSRFLPLTNSELSSHVHDGSSRP